MMSRQSQYSFTVCADAGCTSVTNKTVFAAVGAEAAAALLVDRGKPAVKSLAA
jgi:hypothetical protein